MVRAGEIEHGEYIATNAEAIWNWASPAGKLRARRRANLILEAAAVSEGMRVLEIGCGTGLFTSMFAKTGARIVSIDVSPALLEKAIARDLGERVEFRVDDAEDLSLASESFDAVTGSSVLHHLDLDAAIGEVHRVLKPGGRMVFAEPSMLNPQIALQRTIPALRRLSGASPEETAFFRWRLAANLRRNGFHDVRIQPFDFLHPAVPGPLIGTVRTVGWALERIPFLREIAGSLLVCATREFTGRTASDGKERGGDV